jgi:hypothetical protein
VVSRQGQICLNTRKKVSSLETVLHQQIRVGPVGAAFAGPQKAIGDRYQSPLTIHDGVSAPPVASPDLLNPEYPDDRPTCHAPSTNITNTQTPDWLVAR